MKPTAAFFWRKLDFPGHDSCRLFKLPKGWRLSGAAVFWEDGHPCHFHYEVVTDLGWRTRRARVTGYLGNRPIDLRINAAGADWKVDGEVLKGLAGCLDVDLGFTPATNQIALRRLSLKVGQRAEAPAAYLSFPSMRFVKLPQTYHRTSRSEYDYAAPTVHYAGTLQVASSGAIVHYPGLFERVAVGGATPRSAAGLGVAGIAGKHELRAEPQLPQRERALQPRNDLGAQGELTALRAHQRRPL